MSYQRNIIEHYETNWKIKPRIYLWDKGPIDKMSNVFRILEFEPTATRPMWSYATCCMSHEADVNPIELHLFSKKKDEALIELLTAVSYYHRVTSTLRLWDTVNFGKPWQDVSLCQNGLISLPYVDGPNLENLENNSNYRITKFYWLIPITKKELDYKKDYGIEKLEIAFETEQFDFLDSGRKSVI
jgi:hypothetical protein